MTATTTGAPEAAETTEQDTDRRAAREQRIEMEAQRLYQAAQRHELRKPPEQRTPNTTLWSQARRHASRNARRTALQSRAREVSRNAATTAYHESRSALYRNRTQLAPWLIAAPYAALGEGAWLLAEYGAGQPVAISAAAAVTSTGASLLAWRKKLAQRTGKFRVKAQASLGLLCGWTSMMPLVEQQSGMWLAWLAGLGYMGLSWWRQHEHPTPAAIQEAPAEPVQHTPAAETATDPRQLRINSILAAWAGRVQPEKGPVPGSSLSHETSNDAVDVYRIHLDPQGQVTRKKLEDLKSRIALAIGVIEEKLSLEVTDRPEQVLLRHLVADPVTAYEGPVVLCNGTPINSRWEIIPGATVDIVYGHFTDGDGAASYRVIDKGSVNSLFILGGTGSGKTRLMEIIAIALRFIGARILYIDGQDGASSVMLNTHADAVYESNDIAELEYDITKASAQRNHELRTRPELANEYSYDPQRPPLIVIMEEAHEVFTRKMTKSMTYGQAFGEHGVQIRKLGIGFVAASQDFDKVHTFGNSSKLRSSLTGTGNFAAMRQTDKSRRGMLPSSCPALDEVPPKGYGFNPYAGRAGALWRTPDLDGGSRSKEEWMTAYEPGAAVVTGSARTGKRSETSSREQDESPSPAADGVIHFPSGAGNPTEVSAAGSGAMTAAEQRVRDLLAQESGHSPTSVGRAMDIRSQVAGRHLRSLVKKGCAIRQSDGSYTAN